MKKKIIKFKCLLVVFSFVIMLFGNCSKDEGGTAITVTDIDGNVYHSVNIGTQTWFVENLKTTKYRNGDPIPNVTNNISWTNLTTVAYCSYNNDPALGKEYGFLYNWYAINDSRKLAPAGWHVATDSEWTTLINFLGGETVAGGKLKETGITHWSSPNAGATNESGFTALPGGYRDASDGKFQNLTLHSFFWTSTEDSPNKAWYRTISFNVGNNYRLLCNAPYEGSAGSVRCIKD